MDQTPLSTEKPPVQDALGHIEHHMHEASGRDPKDGAVHEQDAGDIDRDHLDRMQNAKTIIVVRFFGFKKTYRPSERSIFEFYGIP